MDLPPMSVEDVEYEFETVLEFTDEGEPRRFARITMEHEGLQELTAAVYMGAQYGAMMQGNAPHVRNAHAIGEFLAKCQRQLGRPSLASIEEFKATRKPVAEAEWIQERLW